MVDRSIAAIRADTRLSEYADALVRAEAEACSSRESSRAAALQCLDAAATRMRVVVERLSEGHRDVVGSADVLLDELPDPQTCLDADLAGTELPASRRMRAAEVTTALANAETLLHVDRFPEALAAARAVRADIEAHGDDLPRAKSEADALAGNALVELGEYEQGAALLAETHYAATERGDAALAFRTAYFLTVSEQLRGDAEAAATWLRHAEVAAERTRTRPSARANLANVRAMMLAGSGDFAGAEAAFRAGLVECEADECRRTRS